jgi:CRISPR-associated endonuclease/helicase Cas3
MKSHPYVPYQKHVQCLHEYNKHFYQIDKNIDTLIDFHDIGKLNKLFQTRILKIEKGLPAKKNQADNHAVLSMFIYLLNEIYVKKRGDYKEIFKEANIIRGHHGYLKTIKEFVNYFSEVNKDILIEGLEAIYTSDSELGIAFRNFLNEFKQKRSLIDFKKLFMNVDWSIDDTIDMQLKLSRLVDCDRLAAMRKSKFNKRDAETLSLFNFTQEYINRLPKLNDDNDLTKIRNMIDLEKWRKRPEAGIYSLTLPTGVGKTLTALKIIEWWNEGNKSIMVVPFLAVTDQTEKIIRDIYKDYPNNEGAIGGRLISSHHSMSNGKYDVEDDSDDWSMIERWSGSIVITTTVQFFETLMSRNASKLRKLHNTYGATIVIDEPQGISYKYWKQLRRLLPIWTKKLQWRVILLSATPPSLPKETVKMIDNEYELYTYLRRTRLITEKSVSSIDEWIHKAWELTKNNNSILWIVNKKKIAYEIYEKVRNALEREVICITAQETPLKRMVLVDKIKKMIKENKKVLVISTQVLEAGVDLDFDIGVRELAPMPILIQFAGRINRKAAKERSDVYVLPFKNSKYSIYHEEEYNHTLTIINKYNNIINESDYLKASNEYFLMCEQKPPVIDNTYINAYKNFTKELDKFSLIENDYTVNAIVLEGHDDEIKQMFEKATGEKYINLDELINTYCNKDVILFNERRKFRQILNLFSINAHKDQVIEFEHPRLKGLYYIKNN